MGADRTSLRRRRFRWVSLGLVVLVLAVVAWYVVPILTHETGGTAGQQAASTDFPSTVTGIGSDGLTRTLEVFGEDGSTPYDPGAAQTGDRVTVVGTGYDESTGIYVAVCKRAVDVDTRPTPCIGGVPDVVEGEATEDWSASVWVNDSPNWRLFGARPWQDGGSFSAKLLLVDADGSLDCRVDECAIYTRADHTALGDRTQDLFLPLQFAG